MTLHPEFMSTLKAVRHLRACIATPWRGASEYEITHGQGKIAAAYKAADKLDAAMGLVPETHATVTSIVGWRAAHGA